LAGLCSVNARSVPKAINKIDPVSFDSLRTGSARELVPAVGIRMPILCSTSLATRWRLRCFSSLSASEAMHVRCLGPRLRGEDGVLFRLRRFTQFRKDSRRRHIYVSLGWFLSSVYSIPLTFLARRERWADETSRQCPHPILPGTRPKCRERMDAPERPPPSPHGRGPELNSKSSISARANTSSLAPSRHDSQSASPLPRSTPLRIAKARGSGAQTRIAWILACAGTPILPVMGCIVPCTITCYCCRCPTKNASTQTRIASGLAAFRVAAIQTRHAPIHQHDRRG
jgi:hypothetical protein